MTAVTITTFDYSQIADPQLADQVRNTAEEIVALRTGIERDFLLIGQHLLATKEQLPHGQFMDWVEQACGFSQRSAQMLMRVAREFGGQMRNGCAFGVSILDQLAAATAPQVALAEAEALAADGVPVTKAVAASIRDEVASAPAQNSNPAPEESAAELVELAEPAASPEPAEHSLEADIAKVSAAFANGIPVKSIVMVRHLTGITDEIRLMAALNALCVRGELRSAGLTTYQRVAPTATLDGDALDEKICAWLSGQTEPQGALTIGSAVGAYATATKQALERLCETGRIEVARAEYGTKYYRVTISPAASQPQPEAESTDTEAAQEHLVQTSAPDEVPQQTTTITEERLAALAESAVAALRKHGEGMYYNEIKHFMDGENREVNRALTYGVKTGLLTKNPDLNYYSLPEFATRAQTPLNPAAESARNQLIMLVDLAQNAKRSAKIVSQIKAVEGWSDLDVEALAKARIEISAAAWELAYAAANLKELYRVLSTAIQQQQGAAYAEINGD